MSKDVFALTLVSSFRFFGLFVALITYRQIAVRVTQITCHFTPSAHGSAP